MTETVLVRLSEQLDHISEVISFLQKTTADPNCAPIKEELLQSIDKIKLKYKKLNRQYNTAYKEMLELADFLSSVDY